MTRHLTAVAQAPATRETVAWLPLPVPYCDVVDLLVPVAQRWTDRGYRVELVTEGGRLLVVVEPVGAT